MWKSQKNHIHNPLCPKKKQLHSMLQLLSHRQGKPRPSLENLRDFYKAIAVNLIIAGMLTDSCSGDSNAYFMWEVWLRYLWPVVMLIGALVSPALIIMNRRWKWVLLSMLLGAVASIIWYVLWMPVLMLSGC
jgi:hypothetical protein